MMGNVQFVPVPPDGRILYLVRDRQARQNLGGNSDKIYSL
jgi:hypothetical protein